MKILAVDSSSVSASVAILDGSKVLSDFYVNAGLTHSQTLAPMIDLAVKSSGLKISDIDFFASTTGPGSFTGLRIGIATVKGMALGSGKKCMGVSSLLAAAYNCKNFEGLIGACMDARRSEIYGAIFRASGGKITRITQDMAISIQNFKEEIEKYKSKAILVGDGAEMCYNIMLDGKNSEKIELSSEFSRFVSAKNVALAAIENYSEEKLLSPGELTPEYLRLSQAQRMLLEKNNL